MSSGGALPLPPWRTRVTEALSAIGDAVWVLDHDDRFTWVNPAAARLLARPAADLVGHRVWDVLPDLAGSELVTAHRHARDTRRPQDVEVFAPSLDRWLGGRVHGAPGGELVVVVRDVHARRTLDEARAAESSLTRAVLDALPARTAVLDADGTILTTNRAWDDAEGRAGQPFLGRVGEDYLALCRAAAAAGDRDARSAVEGLEAVFARRAPSFALDYARAVPGRRPAEPTWWYVQAFPVDDRPRVVVTHTDVTDRVTAEQQAAWQARHDHLTSLPNRAALHEAITDALAEDEGGRVTVLFMDVDGFKQVNDSLGHAAGDLLLRELASRLAHRTRPTDVVGRLGGDEFVVVARDCDAAGGVALARRFHGVFDEPFELAGVRLPLTVSIGIATSDSAHAGPDDLLRDADAAMYAAKAGGRNRDLVFTPALRGELEDRRQIAGRLRDAASGGEFSVHWQPVLHLGTGEVAGCEALLRWDHPQRGPVLPAAFVPVAEEHGLIVPITRWMLRVALAQGRAWADDGLRLTVGVNVSAVHLTSGSLVDDVLEALEESGLRAQDLLVELTEAGVARDPRQAAEQLAALRAHGVRVAIDDFGTGRSSLAAVASLPVDLLKVDRALVAGPLPDRAAPEAVLGAVVALGTTLGMRVLAEGVETAEHVELARRVGCTYAQGHRVSAPLDAAVLGALLVQGRRLTGRQVLPP